MAYTINLDDDFISADELQLLQTRQAILEKLRVHFGEYSSRDAWVSADAADAKELSRQCSNHSR